MADENPAPEAEASAAPETEAPAAPEEGAPSAPEAEAPAAPEAEEATPEPTAEEAQTADQEPTGEAPPEAETKPEAESDIESTTATGHEGTEGAADVSSSMPSPPGATEEGSQTSVKKQPSKSEEVAGKTKSRSIAFDKPPEEKETEQPPEGEEPTEIAKEEEASGGPAAPEAEEKQPRRKSKTGISSKPPPMPSHDKKKLTVIKSKGDFEGKPRYQNTYRLDSKYPFNVDRVYSIIKTTVDKALEEVKYHPEECSKLVMSLSNEIKTKVKLQGYERYKIAVQVIIGEKKQQSVYSVMRFLWDVERDHYSIYSYENNTLFAIALALGVYYE